ncbi:MAG: hypothetical protein ACR2H4_19835 [Pyrinomonadaceae bacterium]
MPVRQEESLLDHADMRLVSSDATVAPPDRNRIVQLDPDHPGFRDQDYRARRNRIAQIALGYQSGQPIPEAPYTLEEHQVWREVWGVSSTSAPGPRLRRIFGMRETVGFRARSHSAVTRSKREATSNQWLSP